MARSTFRKGLVCGFVLGVASAWFLHPATNTAPRLGETKPAVPASDPTAAQIPNREDRRLNLLDTTPSDSSRLGRSVRVERAVDGDTIIIEGNQSVRLIGVDAPERGEPFFREARGFLSQAVAGRQVGIAPCGAEKKDKYGRLLAVVEMDGADVGIELLRNGLARTLFIGPCAKTVSLEYGRLEREAFAGARGIWSLQHPRRVPHEEAGEYIGWLMTVAGRVNEVHVGPKAVHLNFGADPKSDFTGVIFRKNLSRLAAEGMPMPVTGLKGRHVVITGTIKEYNGPEIIIDSADQIRTLGG